MAEMSLLQDFFLCIWIKGCGLQIKVSFTD